MIHEIAHGGMGVVWRARQRRLDRTVAVKLIRDGFLARPEEVARFATEAAAAARLQHPGIVGIHEIGEIDGRHFYSMELVEGPSLAEALRRGPMPPADTARLIRQVAEAVEHAHSRGVLHRDLKPANILLDGEGRPRVTDFGLAKLVNSDSSLTLTGAVLGSPHYMSPEQARGQEADTRSDVYSLGAILYECLTGRPPFNAANPLDTLRLVLEQTPPPARALNPTLPRDLETIALRCLAKEPSTRYASAQALADDLARFERGEPILARPAGPLERTWRWSRRNPALAALVTLLVAAPLVIIALQYRGQIALREQRDVAERERERAARSEADARENFYAADVNLGWFASQNGDQTQARTIISRHLASYPRFELRLLKERADMAEKKLWQSTNRFLAASLATSGSLLAALTSDGLLALHQTNVGYRPLAEPLPASRWAPPVRTMLLDGPRRRVLLADREGLLVWNFGEDAPARLLPGEFDRLAVRSRDGWIAAAEPSGTNSRVCVLEAGQPSARVERPFPSACALAWDTGADALWIVARDGSVWQWEPTQGEPVPRLPGGLKTLQASFAPDFSRVARTTGVFLHIDDLVSRRRLGRFEILVDDQPRLAWSDDARLLAVPDNGGTVQICQVEDNTILRRFQGHVGLIADLVWTDTNSVLSAGTDGMIRRWQIQVPFLTFTNLRAAAAPAACFSGDGQVLAVGSLDAPLGIWHASQTASFRKHAPALPIACSQDGGRLLARVGSTIRLLDLTGGTERILHEFECSAVATGLPIRLLTDGRSLLIPDHGGVLRTFDVPARRWLNESRPGVRQFADCADGSHVALSTESETWWWDVKTGQESRVASHPALSLAASPDGRRLALGDAEGTIEVWDVAGPARLHTLEAHVGAVRALAFTPDGHTLASGGDDKFVRLWNLARGRLLGVATQALPIHLLLFNRQNDLLFGIGPEGSRAWRVPPLETPVALSSDAAIDWPPESFWAAVPKIDALPRPRPTRPAPAN